MMGILAVFLFRARIGWADVRGALRERFYCCYMYLLLEIE